MGGEVASDLSVFHRVDDMWGMGSRRFALLVPRLYAYSGAVQMKMKAISAQPVEQPSAESGQTQVGGGVPAAPPVPVPPVGRVVESTQAALKMSDIGDMFSYGTVAAPPPAE